MNLLVRRPRNYIQDIQDFQEDFNRMIEDAFSEFGTSGGKQGVQEGVWRPAVQVSEQNGNYLVKAALPGINKDNIDVEVTENNITIKGEMKKTEEEEKSNMVRNELRYGKFVRSVSFPTDIDANKASADFKDGLLTVTLPKTQEEQAKTKKIQIQS